MSEHNDEFDEMAPGSSADSGLSPVDVEDYSDDTPYEGNDELTMAHEGVDWQNAETASLTLPCGVLTTQGVFRDVTIRGFTGIEEDILTSTKNTTAAKNMTRFIGNCITKIGPLENTDTEGLKTGEPKPCHPDVIKLVQSMYMGDRLFLTLAIRMLTVKNGHLYEPAMICPRCNKQNDMTVDLTSVKKIIMPHPEKQGFLYTLPRSGHEIELRNPRGEQAEEMQDKLLEQHPNQAITAQLFMCVRKIKFKGTDEWKRLVGLQRLVSLHSQDRDFIRETIMDIGGGVETEARFTCPEASCQAKFKADIPMNQLAFFFPSAAKSR